MALRTIKKLLLVSVSITCVIYIGRLALPTCFKSQETETQTVSMTTSSGKRSVSEIDLLWPMLGGLRDAKLNDLDKIRSFFRDRPPTKWKVILRVGVGNLNFNALKWADGWEHMREIDCPVTNCYFTSNMSALDGADAVVISNYGKGHEKVLTPKRKHQVWIAQILEPPMMVKIHSNLVKGLVNWTATYRRDSTITIPYGVWTKTELKSIPSRKNYAHGKTKKVAMFVSNCKAISGRIEYAIELNKSIQVDIFGKCGHLNCSKYQECHAMLKKDYKFYLSFENSNCVGYMTEKFHLNALNNDIVPIVMGARREDYVTAAPPHSFVHVDDFLSPGHLGKYLNLLDSNDALYNEYFHYKGRYRLHMYWTLGRVYWCQVCTRLHLMEHENLAHWYDDFNKWWVEACAPKYDKSGWITWNETFES